MRELIVAVPSRGRPERLRLMLGESLRLATADTLIVVATDDDDPERGAYEAMLKSFTDTGLVSWVTGPRRGLGAWTNEIVARHAGQCRAWASFGDDHVPRTEGWDAALLGALDGMGGSGIAYPDDGRRIDIPEAVVISADIVGALGWMCEPALEHYCVDLVWADLGRAARCLDYVPRVVVEHLHYQDHPEVGRDGTYADAELGTQRDFAAYQQWQRERMAADVATVRAVTGWDPSAPRTTREAAMTFTYVANTGFVTDLGDGKVFGVSRGDSFPEGHPVLKAGHQFFTAVPAAPEPEPQPQPETKPEPQTQPEPELEPAQTLAPDPVPAPAKKGTAKSAPGAE